MKRITMIAVLVAAAALTACGGDPEPSGQLGLSRLAAGGMSGDYRAGNGVALRFDMHVNDSSLPGGEITHDGQVVWSYNLDGGELYATVGGVDLREVANGDPGATSAVVAFLATPDGVAVRGLAQDLAIAVHPEDDYAWWVRYVVEIDNILESLAGGTSPMEYPHLHHPEDEPAATDDGNNCPGNCWGCVDGCPFVQSCLFCLSCSFS